MLSGKILSLKCFSRQIFDKIITGLMMAIYERLRCFFALMSLDKIK